MTNSGLTRIVRIMSPSIATAEKPDRAGLLDFIRRRHHALLVTTRRDGRPQISPVTSGVDTTDHIVIATYPERAKAKNVRRHPNVSLCFLSDTWDGPYVQVDGQAEILDLPDAVDSLVDYFRCISGEHPDWDEYRAAMHRQGKSLMRIEIERWGPIATGGFPARLASVVG